MAVQTYLCLRSSGTDGYCVDEALTSSDVDYHHGLIAEKWNNTFLLHPTSLFCYYSNQDLLVKLEYFQNLNNIFVDSMGYFST